MANKTMGNTLKTYMKRHGIKQQFVSDKAGIRPQILGAMLNEKRKIEENEKNVYNQVHTGKSLLFCAAFV